MPLTLTETDRLEMERWVAAHRTPQQVAQRCRIVLTAARGVADNGTTTLFAALDMLEGKVIGQCQGRHRHQEWLKFLRRLDREYPETLKFHLVMDNYGTHKTPEVQSWLRKHPRFVCHFVPTRSSWLNRVERWFRELTDKAIRRGVFRSVADLEKAIAEYLDAWNEKPRPFIWTVTVGEIVEKLDRARAKLEAIQPGCTQPRHRKSEQKAIG